MACVMKGALATPGQSLMAALAALYLMIPCVDAVGQADVTGPPFPVVQIVVITVVTLVVASLVSGLAMWQSARVEKATEKAFAKWGGIVAYYPWTFIVGSLLFIVCCGYGFALQESETDPSKSWVPTGSVVLDHQKIVTDNWPSGMRVNFFMAYSPGGPSGNMLTPSMLQAQHRDMQALLGYVVDGDKIVNANDGDSEATPFAGHWTFDGRDGTQRKCMSFYGDNCAMQSILAVFGMDDTLIAGLTDSVIQDRLAQWEAAPKDSMITTLVPPVWKSFELTDVLAGIERNQAGTVVSATIARTSLFLTDVSAEVKVSDDDQLRTTDPVGEVWEANAACVLGFEEEHPIEEHSCSKPSGVEYTGFLDRSFTDEFGDAIRSDISKIGISYVLIIVYLIVNLGKRDNVHSMISQSFAAILAVGLSFALANGLGGYFGIKTSPLNNNIPFLLLGLGVDDAFVLCSEFVRHSTMSPHLSIEDRIQMTTGSGGLSVLVTSLTDALTFLIGSMTVLPALSSFCVYAGIGVFGCFIFMMTFFLPVLTLNAKRADTNRFDFLCCFKSKYEHKLDQPQGCCCCCANVPDGLLPRAFRKWGNFMMTTMPGKVITCTVFFAIFIVGLTGITQLQTDFKLEWFFPEGSYVKDYFEMNEEHFGQGTTFIVYGHNVDLYEKQAAMVEIGDYIAAQDFIMPGSTSTWLPDFITDTGTHATAQSFWLALAQWLNSAQGSAHESKVQWVNPGDPTQGVSNVKLLDSTLKVFEGKGSGKERFETYYTMRKDISDMAGGSETAVFPYNFNFLYWEEVGVIDSELIRNLIIAFGVMSAIVALLIPKPRIAFFVSLNIALAILEVIGFAHWWGLTMNGPSTIYFLMCAGFSVDYSAHIAHAFNTSVGKSTERAIEALLRLGPSVWNALFSTFLAVIVIGFSKSFVFEVFFKILCLVCLIAGAHGIWLLPFMLSIVGGDSEATETSDQKQVAGEVKQVDVKGANDEANIGDEANHEAAIGG